MERKNHLQTNDVRRIFDNLLQNAVTPCAPIQSLRGATDKVIIVLSQSYIDLSKITNAIRKWKKCIINSSFFFVFNLHWERMFHWRRRILLLFVAVWARTWLKRRGMRSGRAANSFLHLSLMSSSVRMSSKITSSSWLSSLAILGADVKLPILLWSRTMYIQEEKRNKKKQTNNHQYPRSNVFGDSLQQGLYNTIIPHVRKMSP